MKSHHADGPLEKRHATLPRHALSGTKACLGQEVAPREFSSPGPSSSNNREWNRGADVLLSFALRLPPDHGVTGQKRKPRPGTTLLGRRRTVEVDTIARP